MPTIVRPALRPQKTETNHAFTKQEMVTIMEVTTGETTQVETRETLALVRTTPIQPRTAQRRRPLATQHSLRSEPEQTCRQEVLPQPHPPQRA